MRKSTTKLDTPNERKRYVSGVIERVRDYYRQHGLESNLENFFGLRRQRAILKYLDKVKEDFGGYTLFSPLETFIETELIPGLNYNYINEMFDLQIGASLWMLDQFRAKGCMGLVFDLLPEDEDLANEWYLPEDFYHPCYENQLIQAMVHVFSCRYPGHSKRHPCGVATKENASGGKTWGIYDKLLALLPQEAVEKACHTYEEKVWDVITRYMKGKSTFEREIDWLKSQLESASSEKYYSCLMDMASARESWMPSALPKVLFPEGKEVPLSRYMEQLKDMKDKSMTYTWEFGTYLGAERRSIKRWSGSREVADYMADFTVENPYELCFALYYLLDHGDDLPWLMRSGSILMEFCQRLLPWYGAEEESMNWDDPDEDPYSEFDYYYKGWTEREPVKDRLDYLHERHGELTLSQLIYRNTRCLVPINLHPMEEVRAQLVEEGMEEEKARELSQVMDLLFLNRFHLKQGMKSPFVNEDGEYEGIEEAYANVCVGPVGAGFMGGADGSEGDEEDEEEVDWSEEWEEEEESGEWNEDEEGDLEAQRYHLSGKEHLRAREIEEAIDAQREKEEYQRLAQEARENGRRKLQGEERQREELGELKQQVKSLKGLLAQARKAQEESRHRYERELETLRREHRELSDLRELIFQSDETEEERARREKVEKQYEYPYLTRKRTVVFGGHESFLKVIRPMLPQVRFVDVGNYAFNPELVRNAQVVWVQNNCMSHTQFGRVADLTRRYGIQLRYFGYSSAEKCAEQLVTEDLNS